MKPWLCRLLLCLVAGFGGTVQACIWDSKTLSQERKEHPTLAQAILHPKPEEANATELTERLRKLRANPLTNDPSWWNDLAGAHLRLGQPLEATKILEPLTNRFAGDYGIHANLGTAYHLLGRYADAEREIRRDLEINPEAHFGLEKYHLALLQYLGQSEPYRLRHVYVDEFTWTFLNSPPRMTSYAYPPPEHPDVNRKQIEEDLHQILLQPASEQSTEKLRAAAAKMAMTDDPPQYQTKWNLEDDAKLDDGVIYMATLNPKEPACWVMLGLISIRHHDVNLARAAYKEAIRLGSPQTRVLAWHLDRLSKFHAKIFGIPYEARIPVLAIALVLACYIYSKYRDFRAARRNSSGGKDGIPS